MWSLLKRSTHPSGDKRVTARKSKKGENPFRGDRTQNEHEVGGRTAKDIVLNEADRQLYKYDLPQNTRGFGDLLQEHDGENMFPYAAITNEPDEEYDARLRRLTNLQPRINRRRLDVPDHVKLKLYKEVEEFPVTTLLSWQNAKQKSIGYDYISIRRVALIMTPLSSFTDSHSNVIVTLLDLRKRGNQKARSLILTDNMQYKGEFALDYSFPKESAGKVSISVAQEIPTFDTGEQWGAMQIMLEVEESDYPQTFAFQETVGVASLTSSSLQKFTRDPAHLDLAIRDSHRSELQNLYLQGLIPDETEPKANVESKSKYSKSSGAGLKQKKKEPQKVRVGSDGEIDWSIVRSKARPMIPIDQVSEDPGEDDSVKYNWIAPRGKDILDGPVLKSAMKKHWGKMRSPPPSHISEGSDEDAVQDIQENRKVNFDEEQGTSETTPVRLSNISNIRLE